MIKMLEIEPLLSEIKLILKKYDNTDRLHEEHLTELSKQIEILRGTKLEAPQFKEFREYVDLTFSDLASNY